MRKLRMKVEELHVESFDTRGVKGERGTVRAHAETDFDFETCGVSCAGTCGPWTKCDCPRDTITTNDASDSHIYRDGFCI
jgi:hypothetical protein